MQNNKLINAHNIIYTMPCTGLPIDDIVKVLALCKELREKGESYNELRKKLFESYGIKNDEDYFKHADFAEISKQITELDTKDTEIKDGNFLTEPQILKCAAAMPGITPMNIELMKEVLLKV